MENYSPTGLLLRPALSFWPKLRGVLGGPVLGRIPGTGWPERSLSAKLFSAQFCQSI